MTLLIGHRNDPPMGEMGIVGIVTKCCVTTWNFKFLATHMGEISLRFTLKDQLRMTVYGCVLVTTTIFTPRSSHEFCALYYYSIAHVIVNMKVFMCFAIWNL